MRGMVIPVSGTIMILISIIILAMIGSVAAEQTRLMIMAGEISLSTVHESQFTIKGVETAAVPIAQHAAYSLALEGGGFNEWTPASPTLGELRGSLEESIRESLPSGKEQGSAAERSILWVANELKVDKYAERPCENSDCFRIIGNHTFELSDSRILGKIKANVTYDDYVPSSFFKLASVGRKLFDSEKYNISKDSVAWNEDGTFNITTAGSPSCKFKAKKGDYETKGDYYLIPVGQWLNFTLACGIGDVSGLASVGSPTKERIASKFDALSKEMVAQLKLLYPKLDFTFKLEDVSINSDKTSVKVSVTITDEKSMAPVPEEQGKVLAEKDMEVVTVPYDYLHLVYGAWSLWDTK